MRSSVRARSGCLSVSPGSYGTPLRLNAATDAGYFAIEYTGRPLASVVRSAFFSERESPSVTVKPSHATATAGSPRRFHGSLPCSFHARWSPATVPGTPTARWLLWWTSALYFPYFLNMVTDAIGGVLTT